MCVCVIEKQNAHLLSLFSIQNIIKCIRCVVLPLASWQRYAKSKDQLTGTCTYVTFMISHVDMDIYAYIFTTLVVKLCACVCVCLLSVFGIHSMWNKLKPLPFAHLLTLFSFICITMEFRLWLWRCCYCWFSFSLVGKGFIFSFCISFITVHKILCCMSYSLRRMNTSNDIYLKATESLENTNVALP